MTGLTGFVCGQGRAPDLNKGLVFQCQGDLIVTSNFWNVVVNLGLKWYRYQLDFIDLILRQVETFQKNPRSLNTSRYDNWHEIKYS
jgi:hypothetical protein